MQIKSTGYVETLVALDALKSVSIQRTGQNVQDIEMQATEFLTEARLCAEKDDDIER